MPPIEYKRGFMSYNTQSNILLIMIPLAYGLLLATLLLGYFFPGNPEPKQLPWFVWAVIGEVIAMAVATITVCMIVQKRISKKKTSR